MGVSSGNYYSIGGTVWLCGGLAAGGLAAGGVLVGVWRWVRVLVGVWRWVRVRI